MVLVITDPPPVMTLVAARGILPDHEKIELAGMDTVGMSATPSKEMVAVEAAALLLAISISVLESQLPPELYRVWLSA